MARPDGWNADGFPPPLPKEARQYKKPWRGKVNAVSVNVRLTYAQATALGHMVGAVSGYPDVLESLFPDGRERRAAAAAADVVAAVARGVAEGRRGEVA